MKLCPYCSGEMGDAAVVCQHCGRHWKTGAGHRQDSKTGGGHGQGTTGPLWPWVILFAALGLGYCVMIQRVMH